MSDTIQQTITGLSEKTIVHFDAVAALTSLITEAYSGKLSSDEQKQVEAFAGRIATDVERGTIDTYTAVECLDEARLLASAGVPDFLQLIEIGAE